MIERWSPRGTLIYKAASEALAGSPSIINKQDAVRQRENSGRAALGKDTFNVSKYKS